MTAHSENTRCMYGMPESRRKTGLTEIDKATLLAAKTDRERRYIDAKRLSA